MSWRISARLSACWGASGRMRAGANTSPNSWSSRSLRSVMRTIVGLASSSLRMALAT